MSRKCAHLHPSLSHELENLWALIRKCKLFTLPTLWANSELNRQAIRSFLTGLIAAKYVVQLDETFYQLVNDIGVDVPRVRIDGSFDTGGQGRQQMWNSISVLKDFSARDLAFNASTDTVAVTEREAKAFIQYLHLASYLVLRQERTRHRAARYMLVAGMWMGPKPPVIQRLKQVYDPNIKKVVWSEQETGGEA